MTFFQRLTYIARQQANLYLKDISHARVLWSARVEDELHRSTRARFDSLEFANLETP